MDNINVNPIGNPELPPRRDLVVRKNSENDPEAIQDVVEKPVLPEINPISHKKYPEVFGGFRNSCLSIEKLKSFIQWQKDKLESVETERCKDILKLNSSLNGSVEDLETHFLKSGIDILPVLKNVLIKSQDSDEKLVVTKILFSLDRADEFVLNFLIPSLEGKNGFRNLEKNQDFCFYFLYLLGINNKDALIRLLESINYRHVEDIKTFTKSLYRVADPNLLLDCFAENMQTILDNSLEQETGPALKKVQGIILSTIALLEENKATLPRIHLENLYKNAYDIDMANQVAALILKHYPQNAGAIFKERVLDTTCDCDLDRRKRFYAIGNYINSVNEHSEQFLGELLTSEKDQFIAGHLCYSLANRCGNSGKKLLTDLIVNQIRAGTVSIPLGYITQLAKYGEQYLTVLKNILSRGYQNPNSLKNAYRALADVPLISITKSDNVYFNPQPEDMPELVLDLIDKIGMDVFIKWAEYGDEKFSRKEVFKANVLDILECAWEINQNKMYKLLLETMTVQKSEDLNSFKKLAGMSDYGSSM